MFGKKTHLRVAEIATSTLDSKIKGIHDRLGQVYIALSRDISDESRNQCLILLNHTMRDVRELTESADYMKLSVQGIHSDIDLGLESLRRHLLGPQMEEPKPVSDYDWANRPTDPEMKGEF